VCRYDRPWDGKRCHNLHCRFDHFRGRVKFLIDTRAAAAAPEAPEAEYEDDFEEDDRRAAEEDDRREADEEYERECYEQYCDVLRGGDII